MKAIWLSLVYAFFLTACAHRPELINPPAVAMVAARDPVLAREFDEAIAIWKKSQWELAARHWDVLYRKTETLYGEGDVATELAAFYLQTT